MILGKISTDLLFMNSGKIYEIKYILPSKDNIYYCSNFTDYKYFFNNLYFYVAYASRTNPVTYKGVTLNVTRFRPVGLPITLDFYIEVHHYYHDKEFPVFEDRKIIKSTSIINSIKTYNKYQLDKLILINNLIYKGQWNVNTSTTTGTAMPIEGLPF